MANAQNTNANWQNRPAVPSLPTQPTVGVPLGGQRPPIADNMQLKTGQSVLNGPVPISGPPGQPLFRPPSSVNGIASPSVSQGSMQMNGQFSGIRPPVSSGPVMNGPNQGPPFQGNQFNQPRQGYPGSSGQFRPDGPPQNFRPPFSGAPPSSQGVFRPQQTGGPSGMPPMQGIPQFSTQSSQGGVSGPPGVTASQGMARPPLSQAQQTQSQDRPNELPVPFHGHGQYSHQVGMALTPGITPANSGPSSQRSSRTNSPAVINPNLDALEGQFRGTPEQETQPPGNPQQQWSQQHGLPPASQQQDMPPASNFPGVPPSSQQTGVPSWQPDMPGLPPTSQQTGMPSSSQQRFPPPPANQPQFGVPPMSAPNQRPGFPPPQMTTGQQPRFPPTSMGMRPGFPPVSSTSQQPGFPPPPVSTNQVPGFPPTSASQHPRFPPPPTTANQQPGFQPAPTSANQQPGFPPPPSANQQPGFPPPPTSANQQPGFRPPPTSVSQQPGFPPPPTSASQQPGFPPQPSSANQYQGFQPNSPLGQPRSQPYAPQGKTIGEFVNTYPKQNTGLNAMTSNFSNMSVQGSQNINLLQQKKLIPPDGVETPKPVIPNDNRNVNCNPEVFRCTMNNIPQTSALLNKSRLPLGILIHPFKDLSQLPVIQSSVIVRCRSCRTYINPFVYFVDSRRWKCNLCYRVNELPDEFSFDPVSKSYGDPQRRPEIKSATIEFIAPSEYMLRPPQPAVYLYLIDVSFNAIETGYLTVFCETLLDVLDRIPGDSRTQIGFIAYDSSVHFFNLAEGLSQPQMLTVTDVDDIFLPSPDDLLVNLNECKSLVIDLLNQLPTLFENNMETRSALGAALQAAFKMTTATGGRLTVMQTVLPTYGPGALQNREDSTQKTSKDISSLGPATDFYKKLALDCSAQQIAVDLFMFNGQYADIASIECISKFSGGCVSYYPSYHAVRSPHLAEKFEADLRRYLTRKVGFESVMRIRCSKGISIHTFHGNFFVRSTDLLSLPNVNPDAGFGMQMSIEEPLTDMSTMCFQAALLYTSSKGERRIRVHTLCLPVTNQISEIHAGADQQAIIALLAKMAVDRSISSSMSDAREAIVNASIDILNAYSSTLPASQRVGNLCSNDQLKLIPLYCLALLKSTAFRTGISTSLDDRTYALHQCKSLPTTELIRMLYPDLYPIHTIMDVEMVKKGSLEFPKLPLLQLSSANIDRNGAYLLDTGDTIYLYLGSAVNPQFCQDVLDRPHFASIQEGGITELPELENDGSERVRSFITYLLDGRSNGAALVVVREDGKLRMKFFQHFVEDRTESSISYIEFLQQIQMQIKS
ncbi:protein transport protein Sec24A-like isoform X2 [Mercenaria mercenaria]|uniref:protein transport protein Sec24A-like isoform X2 n=1 Tax=Mercenaria mercenaria TaxID=6596 RepID=UPI00234EE2C0|nr:protein transport protein Sec24A-like isoform X2 [Mercenaria mercenaria]